VSRVPCVSIGLPVFNAGEYLSPALDATLGQTFGDFELIISDNASTDSTLDICEQYAREDDRVRIIRQPHNCGVNANHKAVFLEATGEYFRWASADDVPDLNLLDHAVETLRRDEEIVAYVPDTVNIDADGNQVDHPARTLNIRSHDASVRAEAVLRNDYQIVFTQGLMRRSTLLTTSCRLDYFGWDFVLLFELSLRGLLANVEGPLLKRRLHQRSAAHSTRKVAEVRKWVDPSIRSRVLLPHWKWTAERIRASVNAPLKITERLKILRLVLRHARWTRQALWRDIVMSANLLRGKTDEFPF